MCREPTTRARWRTKRRCWLASLALAVEPWRGRPGAGGAAFAPLFSWPATIQARFSLHPLNYALGLAAAAEAAGVRIFEDTAALEIDPAGVRKRVVTSHSRVRAGHVVLAGNVHMTELVPQFAETLLPIFTSVVVTAPLGDKLHEAIRFPGAVSDEAGLVGHHHRVVDGRLMWSGQSSVRLGKPQRQAQALVRRIRRTYPALRGVTGGGAAGLDSASPVTP